MSCFQTSGRACHGDVRESGTRQGERRCLNARGQTWIRRRTTRYSSERENAHATWKHDNLHGSRWSKLSASPVRSIWQSLQTVRTVHNFPDGCIRICRKDRPSFRCSTFSIGGGLWTPVTRNEVLLSADGEKIFKAWLTQTSATPHTCIAILCLRSLRDYVEDHVEAINRLGATKQSKSVLDLE